MPDGKGANKTKEQDMKKLIFSVVSIIIFFNTTILCAGVNYDSVDDIINCSNPASFNDLPRFSVSAWIYPRSIGEGSFGFICAKGREAAPFNGWDFNLQATNRLEFTYDFSSTNGDWGTSANTITLNAWNHVLVTYDNTSTSNTPTFYINGVRMATSVANTPVGTANTDNLRPFTIGNDSATDFTFDGYITEVAYWNVILSDGDAEILGKTRIKRSPLQIKPRNLIGYWPLDDMSNFGNLSGTNTVIDRSSFLNNGTPSNSPQAIAEQVLSYP